MAVIRQFESVEFDVCAAIDFGTDGTGIAFGRANDPDVKVHQFSSGSGVKLTKDKTNILLTREGTFVAFGEDATEKYIHMAQNAMATYSYNESDDDEDHAHDEDDIDPEYMDPSRNVLLFERFKMKLYDGKTEETAADEVVQEEDVKVDENDCNHSKERPDTSKKMDKKSEKATEYVARKWSVPQVLEWLDRELQRVLEKKKNLQQGQKKLWMDIIDMFVRCCEASKLNGKSLVTMAKNLKRGETQPLQVEFDNITYSRQLAMNQMQAMGAMGDNDEKGGNVGNGDNPEMQFERSKKGVMDEVSKLMRSLVSAGDEKKRSINKMIFAIDNEQCLEAEVVFVESLKYIKDVALQIINSAGYGFNHVIEAAHVQWILTVPAIWDDGSKALMSEWCVQAGLINPLVRDHLKIVYEPECASICLRQEIQKEQEMIRRDKGSVSNPAAGVSSMSSASSLLAGGAASDITEQFRAGEKYILVDAGGGTCDIACHEIVGIDSISQCYFPTGGPWGSTYVDVKFMDLLRKQVFGRSIFEDFRRKRPAIFANLKKWFIVSKETYLVNEYNKFMEMKAKLRRSNKEVAHYTKVDFLNMIFPDNDDLQSVIAKYPQFEDFIKQEAKRRTRIRIPLEFKEFFLSELVKREKRHLEKLAQTKEAAGAAQDDADHADDANGADTENAEDAEDPENADNADNADESDEEDTDDEEDPEEELMDEMESKFVNQIKDFFKGEMGWEDGNLLISHKIWKECLLGPIINPMVAHIKKLLDNPKINDTSDNNGFKYLCLVGGLSNSIYLQCVMEKEFGPRSSASENKYNLAIKKPQNPMLAVVEGAVHLGLRPGYVRSYFLPKTYGIAVDRERSSLLKYANKLPPGFIEKNHYIHAHTKSVCVKNLFSVFVRKGDSVNIDDKPIVKKYKRFHTNEPKIQIQIYCSDLYDPLVVTDDETEALAQQARQQQNMRDDGKENNETWMDIPMPKTELLTNVILEFPEECNELEFPVKFYFGQTKLRVETVINGKTQDITPKAIDFTTNKKKQFV